MALSIGSINVNHRIVENPLVGDKNKNSASKIHEEVSFRRKIDSNNRPLTIGNTGKGGKSSNVSSCKQTKSNVLSFTSPTVYNTKRQISSGSKII